MLAAVKEITEAATVVTKWTAVPVAISAAWSRTPTGKAFRWVWKRLVTEPADQRFGRRVGLTVAPLIDDVKAKAKTQHDEQNVKLDAINSRLDDHADRLTDIETAITNPPRRDPEAREREDDHR